MKRKISYIKIFQTLITLLLVGAGVVVLISASKVQRKKNIEDVIITIENQNQFQFLTTDEIEKKLFDNRHLNPKHFSVEKIDLNAMERILNANPWIDSTQIYIDNSRVIHINVIQRKPEVRIFDRSGDNYYIDNEMNVLPIKDGFAHYELVFVNVPEYNNDTLTLLQRTNLLKIANEIKKDSFWNAQTASVIVKGMNEYELIPVLGNHKILLGDTTNIKSKLENVLVFYKNIMNKVGWNKYEVLDARFENQIVASPSIPVKVPVDRALSNMNWVKTIIGKDPNQ
jgi:cell division protein FtsQ